MVAGWTLVCVGQMLSYTERANCTKTKVKYEVNSIEKNSPNKTMDLVSKLEIWVLHDICR